MISFALAAIPAWSGCVTMLRFACYVRSTALTPVKHLLRGGHIRTLHQKPHGSEWLLRLRQFLEARRERQNHTVKRIPFLDGTRGVLAAVVVACHVLEAEGSQALEPTARVCVWVFFVISGWVLTQGWDGHFARFLARRVVRLWPVHLVCLLPCWALGQTVRWQDVTLFPWTISPAVHDWHMANPPDWSMCIEIAAMLFMPAIVRLGRAGALGVLAAAVSCLGLALLHPFFLMLPFFVLGAYLSRFDVRFPPLEWSVPIWLGKVSYSLYLSHWVVLQIGWRAGGAWGLAAAVPVSFVVAQCVWWAAERPSIALSRRVHLFTTRPGLRMKPGQLLRSEAIAQTPIGSRAQDL